MHTVCAYNDQTCMHKWSNFDAYSVSRRVSTFHSVFSHLSCTFLASSAEWGDKVLSGSCYVFSPFSLTPSQQWPVLPGKRSLRSFFLIVTTVLFYRGCSSLQQYFLTKEESYQPVWCFLSSPKFLLDIQSSNKQLFPLDYNPWSVQLCPAVSNYRYHLVSLYKWAQISGYSIIILLLHTIFRNLVIW